MIGLCEQYLEEAERYKLADKLRGDRAERVKQQRLERAQALNINIEKVKAVRTKEVTDVSFNDLVANQLATHKTRYNNAKKFGTSVSFRLFFFPFCVCYCLSCLFSAEVPRPAITA